MIGGVPRYDTDPNGQIRRIFELAREYDVDIDLHLDVGDTPEGMLIHYVCELTEQYRRCGRVVVGHMTKLSLIPPGEVAVLASRLADIGVAQPVLPCIKTIPIVCAKAGATTTANTEAPAIMAYIHLMEAPF